MAYLSENGVYTGIHYPIPCHLQKAYSDLNYPVGSFENGELLADAVVSLPMSEQLSNEQVSYVCNLIKQYYQK
jgi:dTDP-4-amino-4,6-dideoxygalactose transaminase